jgi:hypothetical protein
MILGSYRVHNVGKQGVRLLQAKEHLMHIVDMGSNWPADVPGRDRLLAQVRHSFALNVVMSAAKASHDEAEELLEFLPEYGNFLDVRLLGKMVRMGGSPLIRQYIKNKLWLRQKVKELLYKKLVSNTQAFSEACQLSKGNDS